MKITTYNRKIPFVRNIFRNRVKIAIKFASITHESTILDAGCSVGYLLIALRNQNNSCKYYGIDKKSTYDIPSNIKNCSFQVGDIKNMDYNDNFFDAVFLLDILEHIEDVETAIKEVHRVLKPNGVAILSGPTETWFYKICRLLWLHKVEFSFHKHTIYDIEHKFESNKFELISWERLPRTPLPELFRISKFKKIH